MLSSLAYGVLTGHERTKNRGLFSHIFLLMGEGAYMFLNLTLFFRRASNLYIYIHYVFPYQLYNMFQLGHSIYHEFTRNLNTLIMAYEYKELHFSMFQSETFFFIHSACSSLFVAYKDQIIFISPYNCSFNRTYSCTIFLGYNILSKHICFYITT